MRRREHCLRHGQSGTTYVEVVVAILITTVVIGLLYLALATGLRSYSRSANASARTAMILRIDDHLREMAGRIRAPFWPVAFAEASDQEIRISYYEGDPNQTLLLRWTADELRFTLPITTATSAAAPASDTADQVLLQAPISGVRLMTDGRRVIGLAVEVGEPAVTIEALFAGWGLP
ncbi:MAG: PulJ/GspJ family protein [Spirochaetota bacterium]